MDEKLTRRELLGVGTAVGGMALGGSVLGATSILAETHPSTELPWPYKKLNTKKVYERAYESAWADG